MAKLSRWRRWEPLGRFPERGLLNLVVRTWCAIQFLGLEDFAGGRVGFRRAWELATTLHPSREKAA